MTEDNDRSGFLKIWENLERPFEDFLGLEMVSAANGEAHFTVALKPFHKNAGGMIHGGLHHSMIDTAMGAAAMSKIMRPAHVATIEIKMQYLAVARGERLDAYARVIKLGKSVCFLEGEVRDEHRLVAKSTGTFFVGNIR